jgi:hypothetical protein
MQALQVSQSFFVPEADSILRRVCDDICPMLQLQLVVDILRLTATRETGDAFLHRDET